MRVKKENSLKQKCINIIKKANIPVKINYVVNALLIDYGIDITITNKYPSKTIKWCLKEYQFKKDNRVYFVWEQKSGDSSKFRGNQ